MTEDDTGVEVGVEMDGAALCFLAGVSAEAANEVLPRDEVTGAC